MVRNSRDTEERVENSFGRKTTKIDMVTYEVFKTETIKLQEPSKI